MRQAYDYWQDQPGYYLIKKKKKEKRKKKKKKKKKEKKKKKKEEEKKEILLSLSPPLSSPSLSLSLSFFFLIPLKIFFSLQDFLNNLIFLQKREKYRLFSKTRKEKRKKKKKKKLLFFFPFSLSLFFTKN